ncbi:Beta-1-3-galactosyltransferase 5-like 6 [Homarus americanus]|uniref:Hexosyltransferase n=1 Tax=Homarus americanus TaxID=6706 RepID=A0A8J5MQD5_HOMAM|nr:Beta-1-3-galactosyltransferase 5-like 6 [Homarus americanus]
METRDTGAGLGDLASGCGSSATKSTMALKCPQAFHCTAFDEYVNLFKQDRVTAEAKQHGDIAQDLSFHDSYSNLTLKTLSLLSWAQNFCRDTSYVLKIDDDVFLNVKRLYKLTVCVTEARQNIYRTKREDNPLNSGLQELTPFSLSSVDSSLENLCNGFKPHQSINYLINSQSHEYESYMFAGYLYDGIRADRNPHSKWYLDPKIYSSDILPPFLSGTSYIMTSNIIPHLLEEAKSKPIIELEDVYISGLVGYSGLKLKLSHLEGWSRFRPRWDSPCMYRELITAHGLSPSELSAMTRAINNLSSDDCNGFLVYLANSFNSFVSSIFPRLPK